MFDVRYSSHLYAHTVRNHGDRKVEDWRFTKCVIAHSNLGSFYQLLYGFHTRPGTGILSITDFSLEIHF